MVALVAHRGWHRLLTSHMGCEMKHADVIEMVEAQNALKNLGGAETSALANQLRWGIGERKKRIVAHQATIRKTKDFRTIEHCRKVIADSSKELRSMKEQLNRIEGK